MSLIREDDLRHAHGPAQWWSESFDFNFFDSEGGLGGFIPIAFTRASGVTDGIFVPRQGNGKSLLVGTYAPWSPADCRKGVVAAGALTARCKENSGARADRVPRRCLCGRRRPGDDVLHRVGPGRFSNAVTEGQP